MITSQPAPFSWRAPPLVLATLIVHMSAICLAFIVPQAWPWLLAAVAANHLVLTSCVLFPRSSLLGPNIVRLPADAARRGEVALSFDDGPDPDVTPQVLELLDRSNAKASFFCIGEKALEHPALVREIVRRGHSVENHSYRHPVGFAFYGPVRLRREIDAAQSALHATAGQAPGFFRAPAGFRSPFLDWVLATRGLRYASWTRRGFDTVTQSPERVLARLTHNLAAGDVLLLHDGCSLGQTDQRPILKVLPALLERLSARNLRAVSLPIAFAHDA